MMMTAVSTPIPAPTPGTTFSPVPTTPQWQDSKSAIAGAKKLTPRVEPPSLSEGKTTSGDSFNATASRDSGNKPASNTDKAPTTLTQPSQKKNINWPLIGGIVVAATAAVGLIAYLAKGGEKNIEPTLEKGVENAAQGSTKHAGEQAADHVHHDHAGDGKATCTVENCSHDHG